jgi:hypothetical protein
MAYEKLNAENRQRDAAGCALKYIGFMHAGARVVEKPNEFKDLRVGARS